MSVPETIRLGASVRVRRFTSRRGRPPREARRRRPDWHPAAGRDCPSPRERIAQVGYNVRFAASMTRARQLLDQGLIGGVVSVSARGAPLVGEHLMQP